MNEEQRRPKTKPADRPRAAFSREQEDGTMVESLHHATERRTAFCIWQAGVWREAPSVNADGERLVPYSPLNNLLQHGVVLLPTGPVAYESETSLLALVQAFIHRYVD